MESDDYDDDNVPRQRVAGEGQHCGGKTVELVQRNEYRERVCWLWVVFMGWHVFLGGRGCAGYMGICWLSTLTEMYECSHAVCLYVVYVS